MWRMALLPPAVAVVMALGAIGSQVLVTQSTPVEGAEGRELLMYRADFVPGGVLGRHFHPGPELLYVLEGALILEQDGHPPEVLKPGESAYLPFKHIHKARNASNTEQVKVLVFLVGEKGQPIITLCNSRLTSAPDRRPPHASEDGAGIQDGAQRAKA